jgi:hypothetical protein
VRLIFWDRRGCFTRPWGQRPPPEDVVVGSAPPHLVVWLARKDSNLRSPDPEDSRRYRCWSVLFERGEDSDTVNPAGSQVEHAGPSQVNVIRSGNSGINRIGLNDRWDGEWFPPFPVLQDGLPVAPRLTSAGQPGARLPPFAASDAPPWLSPPRRPRSPAKPRCRHRGSRATRVSTNGAHAYRPPGVRQLRVLPRLLLRPDRPAR